MKKAMNRKIVLLLGLCLVLSFAMLTGCGSKKAAAAAGPTDFAFDSETGEFSFNGIGNADYYTVWVLAVDDAGKEAASYVAASQRLTGTDKIIGSVDISALAYGGYNVKLLTFLEGDADTPDPVVEAISVTGKLSTPEFKYVQDGTTATVTLGKDTLTTYNENEKFTDINVNIYDGSGSVVSTETITNADLVATQMGPFKNYSAEKAITLDEGTYQISLMAAGDGEYAEASDESEKIQLVVASGAASEGKTSGYTESNGMPGQ